MPKPFLQGLLLAAVVVGLDQLSKWWILEFVMNPPQRLEVTPFFNIVLTYNRGVSFGMFAAGSEMEKWALVGVAILILLFLLRWLWQTGRGWTVVTLAPIIGGAVGNVIDRVIIGAVVDFLDFHIAGQHWPAFNVADSCICIGAAGLIFESFFIKEDSA